MTTQNQTTSMPETLEEAMQEQAQMLINAFSSEESPIDGTQLNFSQSSLMLVDQILRDFYIDESPLPEDLHFIVSCYVFETLRQNLGGEYLRSEAPNEFVLVIGKPEYEVVCLVMERVWGCAHAWEKNTLVTFYDGITEQLKRKKSIQLGAVPL